MSERLERQLCCVAAVTATNLNGEREREAEDRIRYNTDGEDKREEKGCRSAGKKKKKRENIRRLSCQRRSKRDKAERPLLSGSLCLFEERERDTRAANSNRASLPSTFSRPSPLSFDSSPIKRGVARSTRRRHSWVRFLPSLVCRSKREISRAIVQI